jgi:hypothetical protein
MSGSRVALTSRFAPNDRKEVTMSMTPLKMTFGSAHHSREARPIAAHRSATLALLIALGLLVAAALALAPAVRTTDYRPGAHGRVNALAGGRLAARSHAIAHSTPVTLSGPESLGSATVAAPATVSGPAIPRHAVVAHLAAVRRHTIVTAGRTRAGGAALGLGRASTTVSAASVALGIATICGLLIAAAALAVAVPTPSGGSRRGADAARLGRLPAKASLSQRRAA